MGFGRAVPLVAFLLAGCASLPGSSPPPADTFELSAPSVPAKLPRKRGVQILIAEPTALKALDSQ
nr:ABC transporter [Rhizobiaceae bacterium]